MFTKGSRLPLLSLLAGAAALLAVAVGGALNWPFTREQTIKLLQSRSDRQVTIGGFEKTFFPPGLVATDILFLRHDHPTREALIQIKRLEVRGSWADLIRLHRHVPQVDVYNMRLFVPPRGVSPDGQHHTLISLTAAKSSGSLAIDKICIHRAHVEFLPAQDDAAPFHIDVKELTLTRVGNNQPFAFEAVVENGQPKGDVHEKGTFGPWNEEEPSRTPVRGVFDYHDARLSDIPGISGTMQCAGKFSGTLDRVDLEGAATIPDFRVTRSSHTESLTSTFQASLDATNGDVFLKQVDTRFGGTLIRAEGKVSSVPHSKGKFATLEARVDRGRAEDLENLFIKARYAPLVGAVSLATSIRLSPGTEPFLKRLEMAGHFETGGERFRNAKTQNSIDRLAESDRATVKSSMTAKVAVKAGVAHISDLRLTATATAVRIDGTFDLSSMMVNLNGTLRTTGKLSDMETGFKAFAIKVITPFLKRQGATVVPFVITGEYGDLHARMNLTGKRKL